MPLRPGRVRASRTRSNGRSAIWARPSSPETAVSTAKPSIWRRVWRDSRISASSSTMSTEPAGDGFPFTLPRGMTAASDMDCLPAQGEVESEGRAATGIAFDPNLPGVFLNNAVGHRETESCASVLAFLGGRLGGEERIVDAMNVFGRNAGPGVGAAYTHEVAVGGGNVQLATAGHGVFRVEEQIQEYLLEPSRVS